MSEEERERLLDRLLRRPDLPSKVINGLDWGSFESSTGKRVSVNVRTEYPAIAGKLAYRYRCQLALAVSILCPGVEGPGAARNALWKDVDLKAGLWKVHHAHVYPGRKSRRGRTTTFQVRIPARAVEAFRKAWEIRDGMLLLSTIVKPNGLPLAWGRGEYEWPLPPPPGRNALVFPGRKPRDPRIPEHAFREMLKRMDVRELPRALVQAGGRG